jgi:hypothetical protein
MPAQLLRIPAKQTKQKSKGDFSMKINISVTRKDELARLNEEYKDAIAAEEYAGAALSCVLDGFDAVYGGQPEKHFLWNNFEEIVEAHEFAERAIERIKYDYQSNWMSRYKEYLAMKNLLESGAEGGELNA